MLGRILFGLTLIKFCPEVNISFKVKDAESARNLLLASAIRDAKNKAEIIAKEAEVTIENILDVNYSFSTVEFSTKEYECITPMLGEELVNGEVNIDIEPEEIEVTDTVTIVFAIK